MTLATTATHYTPEDLLALPDYGRYELIDGQLVERKTGARASYVATNLLVRMKLRSEEQLAGEDVLPGFQCQGAAVFQGL
jgi:hypothetical protein